MFLLVRIWWTIVFIVSISFCCLQIVHIYNKWLDNPVIITFDQKFKSIGELPFPAITICLPFMVNETVFDYATVMTDLLQRGPSQLDQEMVHLFNITSETCLKTIKTTETREQVKHLFKNYTIELPLPPSLLLGSQGDQANRLFSSCRGIAARQWNCSQHFKRIITPEGSCFTFNMLSKDTIFKKNT